MPAMDDPNFEHTVCFVCHHDDDGAMGLVINRPLDMTIDAMFEQLDLPTNGADVSSTPLYIGGPVDNERGFVLHSAEKAYAGSTPLNASLTLTTSPDVLTAIANDEGPKHYLIALGYAGWESGQLEQEMLDNTWLTSNGDNDILFKLPIEKRWEAAFAQLGISPNALSTDVGHA